MPICLREIALRGFQRPVAPIPTIKEQSQRDSGPPGDRHGPHELQGATPLRDGSLFSEKVGPFSKRIAYMLAYRWIPPVVVGLSGSSGGGASRRSLLNRFS